MKSARKCGHADPLRGSGEYLVLNFNTEADSEEWNINHNEKCDPGG